MAGSSRHPGLLIATWSLIVAVFGLLTAVGVLPLWINAVFPVIASSLAVVDQLKKTRAPVPTKQRKWSRLRFPFKPKGTTEPSSSEPRISRRWVVGLIISLILGTAFTVIAIVRPAGLPFLGAPASDEPADGSRTSRSTEMADSRAYDVKVDYQADGIESKVFTGGLAWQVDLCLAAPAGMSIADYLTYLQGQVDRGNVQMWTGAKDARDRVPATPEVTGPPNRCGEGELNLQVPMAESMPVAGTSSGGWSACKSYRLFFAKTQVVPKEQYVDMCVHTRADLP